MRAVWADAFGEGLRSPEEIDRLVDFAVAAGLDALVVQATRRGDAFARKLGLPPADDALAPPPFDPMTVVCERAQAAGVAVHAWISVTPVGEGAAPPEQFAPLVCRRADGVETDPHGIVHLDPALPAARDHVAGVAATLAARYPVHGISLDRVRYPDAATPGVAEWGYHPEALERFAADGGGVGVPAPGDPSWQAWRRQQVTALVDEVADAARGARPGVEVSVNGCCVGGLEGGWEVSRPYRELGQDWVGWLRSGLVDRVLAMNYRGDADDADLAPDARSSERPLPGAVAEHADPVRLCARFDDWARLAVGAGGDRAVVGTGLYLHSTADSLGHAARAMAFDVSGRRSGGWCGFSYRTPSRAVLRGVGDAAADRAELAAGLRGLAP